MTKNVSSIVLVVVLSLNQSFFSIISVHAAEKSNNNIVANSKYKNASTYYIILNNMNFMFSPTGISNIVI